VGAACPLRRAAETGLSMGEVLQVVDSSIHPMERRLHARRPVRSIAYVELDEGNGGIVLNVSEGGMAVHAVVGLMEENLPQMRIQLPQQKDWVEIGARVAWTGMSRRIAGLEFTDLPELARNQIRDWLSREAVPVPSQLKVSIDAGNPTSPPCAAAAGTQDPPSRETETVIPCIEAPTEESGMSAESVAPPQTPEALAATEAVKLPPPPKLNSEAPSVPSTAAPVIAKEIPHVPARRSTARPARQPRLGELSLVKPQRSLPADVQGQRPRRASVFALVGFLAAVSLAAGWAAGRGAFDPILASFRTTRTQAAAVKLEPALPAASSEAPAPQPTARVADNTPSVVQASQPVSVAAPAGPSAAQAPAPRSRRPLTAPSRTPATRIQTPVAYDSRNLGPTIHRPRADYSAPTGADVAPTMTDLPGSSDSILGNAAIGARGPVAPPVRQAAVLKPAELARRVDAVYPAIARQQRIEGTVILKVAIGPDGTVREARVVSGPAMLANAAVTAVRQWRYSPARLDGNPIEVENQINVEFRLP